MLLFNRIFLWIYLLFALGGPGCMECPLLEEVYEQYVLGVQESGCCAEMPLRPGCCTPDHSCKTRSYSSSYTQSIRTAQSVVRRVQKPEQVASTFSKVEYAPERYLTLALTRPYRARAALPDDRHLFLEVQKLRT